MIRHFSGLLGFIVLGSATLACSGSQPAEEEEEGAAGNASSASKNRGSAGENGVTAAGARAGAAGNGEAGGRDGSAVGHAGSEDGSGGAGGEKGGQGKSGAGGAAGADAARGGGANAGGVSTGAGGMGHVGGAAASGGSAGLGGGKADSGLADGGRAGTDAGQTVKDGSAGGALPCGPTLPAVTDYSAPGPFSTTTDSNVGPGGKCVVYRPKTLGENGFLHSPIVFGPGIGMQATQLKDLLLSFASHGFVVIGTDVLNGGPNDPANKAAMQSALDWIIQQNTQAGTYQGKLNVKCAVSMGYSVGGTAAVELGGHEAVATTVSIHGHVATSAMHGPLLQTSGDKDTVGRPMQQQTFDKSQVQTFFGTVSGADHGYIQQDRGGVERVAITAWLRYWINNDTGAKRYFWGDDCVACVSPWMEPKRKNWQ